MKNILYSIFVLSLLLIPVSSFAQSPEKYPSTPAIYLQARNLQMGSKGDDVTALQIFLKTQGYFNHESTGYFGRITRAAVRAFQKNSMRITPTGIVGPKTRAAIAGYVHTEGETFSGTVNSVSTYCYSDGTCSVIVDGREVITTIGWKQGPVGSIKWNGISHQDDLNDLVGHKVTVYALRIGSESVALPPLADTFTLYGSNDYYISVNS